MSRSDDLAPSQETGGGAPDYDRPTYDAVLRAICAHAARMRKRDHDVVLACLWRAGVHPAGFNPEYGARRLADSGDATTDGGRG